MNLNSIQGRLRKIEQSAGFSASGQVKVWCLDVGQRGGCYETADQRQEALKAFYAAHAAQESRGGAECYYVIDWARALPKRWNQPRGTAL